MAPVHVVHFAGEATSQASRIAVQLGYSAGEVQVLRPMRPNMRIVRRLAVSREPRALIFHETAMLPACLAAAAYVRAKGLPHVVVFDVHDLYDSTTSSRGRRRAMINALAVNGMLRALPLMGVRTMTVSEGLADAIADTTGTRPQVVMSVLDASLPSREPPMSRRVVYFGQVRPDRIPIDVVRRLQSAGWIVDVYGYPPESSRPFSQELIQVLEEGHGEYLGPYAPNDLTFLEGYSASLMLFANDIPNIRNCMPNKLFQSLTAGCPCIVSPFLDEVRHTFGRTGAVPTLDEFLGEPQLAVRWEEVAAITDRLRRSGETAFRRTIVGGRAQGTQQ